MLRRKEFTLIDAQAEIIRLRLEISRLEHALTSEESLKAMMQKPPVLAPYDYYKKHLTPRENEVLIRIMAGDSVSEISHLIFVSDSTTKAHIRNIYSKLHVHNRAAAAIAGIGLGLEVPEDDEGEHDE